MKFAKTTLLAALAAATSVEAFVPSHSRSLSFLPPSSASPVATSSLSASVAPNGILDKIADVITAPEIDEADVRSLFYLWNSALATGDSAQVASLYAKDGFLLPTVSDVPRTDYNSIMDYFDTFLELKPQGEILEGNIKIGHNWAKDAGIYEFTMGKDGSKVKARYSFIYTYEEGQWKIAHHHSSAMPEQMEPKGPAITESEVQDLFYVWNDALATGDPQEVAKRYSKKAVLLPTISDETRSDESAIADYFVNFLSLKPSGKILESHVTIGNGWCKDAGIYEFTLGKDGSTVRARYSFVYVYEDGEWKISHHHSSSMPTSKTATEGSSNKPTLSQDQVKDLFYLWNDALATLDPEMVAKRYSSSPVLLPTVSDEPRTDFEGLKDYFTNFLQLKPQGTILESHVTCGEGWCKDVGIYEFTMGSDGSKVKARYSFVYTYEDGEWKISHHHSSAMPEESKGKILENDEIRNLFTLWNDALATLDPETVAMRYSSRPVLLPTVSDEPRTDFAGIKDYFVTFLELKPQGEILESHVTSGPNWAKDVGVYEFTLGKDGSKVRARYSFVYTYEDGEWKIAHHHSSAMPEQAIGETLSDEDVRSLFTLWNDALATLDPETVAKRYSSQPVLLPTVSDEPRTDFEGLKDYFTNFLELKPQGEILESHVTSGPNWAKDAGIYEFTLGKDGSKVKARYSFVYVFEDGEWKISHHHSSTMPEAGKADSKAAEAEISEEEVKGLFGLWNDALATLDSDAVAKRYAKDAVLLPTVSDAPCTDYNSIKKYFDAFLERKPQGEILESHVVVGDGWCKDVGIYEFTMGSDGSKVKARYSFVYAFEDGEWKISHHHSSAMPEGLLDAASKLAEVEKLLEELE